MSAQFRNRKAILGNTSKSTADRPTAIVGSNNTSNTAKPIVDGARRGAVGAFVAPPPPAAAPPAAAVVDQQQQQQQQQQAAKLSRMGWFIYIFSVATPVLSVVRTVLNAVLGDGSILKNYMRVLGFGGGGSSTDAPPSTQQRSAMHSDDYVAVPTAANVTRLSSIISSLTPAEGPLLSGLRWLFLGFIFVVIVGFACFSLFNLFREFKREMARGRAQYAYNKNKEEVAGRRRRDERMAAAAQESKKNDASGSNSNNSNGQTAASSLGRAAQSAAPPLPPLPPPPQASLVGMGIRIVVSIQSVLVIGACLYGFMYPKVKAKASADGDYSQ